MSCKVKSEAFVGRYYLAVEFLGGFCHKAALIQYTLREMPYNKPFGPGLARYLRCLAGGGVAAGSGLVGALVAVGGLVI